VRVARLDLEAPPGEHAGRYDAVILLALVERCGFSRTTPAPYAFRPTC